MRSALMILMPSAICRIAAAVAGSSRNRKRVAKRAARSRRSLSSPKRSAGSPMARMTPAARSSRPPT
jgi:hypothetical protein